MSGWQSVFKTELDFRAEIVKDFLINKDISAVIVDKKDSSYRLGLYEVHVPAEDVLRAINLINNDIKFE
ncbi:DUF2007 domain-containing protein [Fulvivirgaceae bacterium BMA10]|uniref:DUF2007 domain-containing protein n=1 Tax=Splendidivirga corallicola TaxID=3051826 RepID=A0ABT8KUH6_9BACT|nr:DUF2007 domain-containing protein [Fulvivirgaceae bacterium BMA10]